MSAGVGGVGGALHLEKKSPVTVESLADQANGEHVTLQLDFEQGDVQ